MKRHYNFLFIIKLKIDMFNTFNINIMLDKKKSKSLSFVLRHRPEQFNIKLDKSGWANVSDIIKNMKITMIEIEMIVTEDDKSRFSFNNDKTKIKANQGHSIEIDHQFQKVIPNEILFHGTSKTFLDSIMRSGLDKMKRHHVHLHNDPNMSLTVGARHGPPVVLKVDVIQMVKDKFIFYKSVNEVFLVDHVPAKYLSIFDSKLINNV